MASHTLLAQHFWSAVLPSLLFRGQMNWGRELLRGTFADSFRYQDDDVHIFYDEVRTKSLVLLRVCFRTREALIYSRSLKLVQKGSKTWSIGHSVTKYAGLLFASSELLRLRQRDRQIQENTHLPACRDFPRSPGSWGERGWGKPIQSCQSWCNHS